ncbi:hypothetical protein ABKN59_001693 [Abortiporus biennis]
MNRTAVINDSDDWIPAIPCKTFIKVLLPEHPDTSTTRVVSKLKKTKVISKGRWKASGEDPKGSKPNENQIFHKMQDICDAVINVAQKCCSRSPTFLFRSHPYKCPESDSSYPTKTYPDGSFIFKNAANGASVSWFDIAVPVQYKQALTKKITGTKDDENVVKSLWSMHHVLRVDPSRRFTYGITVEGTSMRLWFSCHSAVVVSEPFNFTKEPDLLVSAVIAFAFASEEQLGWDGSVKLYHPVNDHPFYTFEFHEWKDDRITQTHTYRIIEPLSSETTIGTATRVYKAVLVDPETLIPLSGAKEVTLKDYWLETDRASEGEVHKAIHAAATNETEAQMLRDHLITIIHEGPVINALNGKADNTISIMNGLDLRKTKFKRFQLKHYNKKTRQVKFSSISHPALSSSHIDSQYVSFGTKRHLRIVFAEVGVPLCSIGNPHAFFATFRDIIIVLQVLVKLGYCDVSAENGLDCNGVGKLFNLEHAKLISVEGSHEIRTDTHAFMACEVAQGAYFSYTTSVTNLWNPKRGHQSLSEDFWERSENPHKFPFYPNALHDLESVWWICLWALLFHYIVEDTNRKRLHAQLRNASNIFSHTTPNGIVRQELLTTSRHFGAQFRAMYLDREFSSAADFLEFTRVVLHMFEGVHEHVLDCLNDRLESIPDTEWKWYDSSIDFTRQDEEDEEEEACHQEEEEDGTSEDGTGEDTGSDDDSDESGGDIDEEDEEDEDNNDSDGDDEKVDDRMEVSQLKRKAEMISGSLDVLSHRTKIANRSLAG